MKHLILIDSHVHIYDCFDVNRFLTAAYDNFSTAAERDFEAKSFSGALLMTETSRDHWFEQWALKANESGKGAAWRFYKTGEDGALCAKSGEKQLFLIAGRQIMTAEGLEVLALFSRNTYPDGRPITEVLDVVSQQGALPVIPWGAGKWLGGRGGLLSRLLEHRPKTFLLGDNGGRPSFWKNPEHFKTAKSKDLRILPGSDPLPFPGEVIRVAAFGAGCEAVMDDAQPGKTIKNLIEASDARFVPYGVLESPVRFFRNQVAMHLVKRNKGLISCL